MAVIELKDLKGHVVSETEISPGDWKKIKAYARRKRISVSDAVRDYMAAGMVVEAAAYAGQDVVGVSQSGREVRIKQAVK